MMEKIKQLSKGIVEHETAKLHISPSVLDVKLIYGSETKYEIEINSLNNRYFKAIAYSSDLRIKVLESHFGGLKTKIHIEADASCFLSKKDIKGNIYLISSAGEFTIPFIFRRDIGQTHKLLQSLDSIDSLIKIAKADFDMALCLFSYKDFTAASFMKDNRLNALYAAITKGSVDKSALEEFLCAAKVKERVELHFEKKAYIFAYNGKDTTFSMDIRKLNWGYLNFEVSSDSEFIDIRSKYIDDKSFTGDICRYSFDIKNTSMLKRHNKARLIFKSAALLYDIELEIVKNEDFEIEERIFDKKYISSYLNLRLQYEYEADDIIPELMILELDELVAQGRSIERYNFYKAEAYCLMKKYKEASDILDSFRERVLALKDDMYEEYILYEYVNALIEDEDDVNHSFVKLLRDYIAEDNYYMMPMLIKFDRRCKYKPSLVFELINEAFYANNRSPFLYMEYIKFIENNMDFLHDLSNLELQAFNFAMDRDILSKEMVDEIVQRAKGIRKYSKLSYILFRKIYEKYKEKDQLEALCAVLIRGDIRDNYVNKYFKSAIDADLELFGIYEQYVYSLDKTTDKLLDEKVLNYFLQDNILDKSHKSVLYANIVQYADRKSDIYQEYKPFITHFMLEQISAKKIDAAMLVIYNALIDVDTVDSKLAKLLPDILSIYKVNRFNRDIKRLLIIYPELNGEYTYDLDEENDYVPIFAKDAIVLLEDDKKNRYHAEVSPEILIKKKDEILESCYILHSEHIIYKLAKLRDILMATYIPTEDVSLMQRATADKGLSDSYRANVLSKLIAYLREDSKTPSGPEIWNVSSNYEFLIRASNDSHISIEDRAMICDTLINLGYIKESYQIIQKIGIEFISNDSARRLCNKLITDKLKLDDNFIKYLALKVFKHGDYDISIMEYLCKNFNYAIKDMYDLLRRAVIDNVETYDLEERVLVYIFFTGNLKYIDQVFAWYVSRKKTDSSIISAYFSVKCVEYFIHNKTISAHVFDRLEQSIFTQDNYNSIPLIYQLAISKYYSGLAVLSAKQQEAVSHIVDNLMAYPIVFPYFKKLFKFISLPQDILDKEFLVYKASSGKSPRLKTRLRPYELSYTEESFDYNYMNIYIKEKLLFSGDRWEYMIYENVDGIEELKLSDAIVHNDTIESLSNSRFDRINEIDILLNDEEVDIYDENLIKDRLIKYLMDDELAREIFNLM